MLHTRKIKLYHGIFYRSTYPHHPGSDIIYVEGHPPLYPPNRFQTSHQRTSPVYSKGTQSTQNAKILKFRFQSVLLLTFPAIWHGQASVAHLHRKLRDTLHITWPQIVVVPTKRILSPGVTRKSPNITVQPEKSSVSHSPNK